MRRRKSSLSIAVLAGGLLAAAYLTRPDLVSRVSLAVDGAQAPVVDERLSGVQALSESFRSVYEALRPSVVSVVSTKVVRASPRQSPEGMPDPFREFFGDEFWERFFGHRVPPEGFRQSGLGSGVIVSADGHILTNNHVVAGADDVTVKLHDDRELKAKVVGLDPKTDLAVIQVEGEDLRPAVLGDAEKIQVGDWVLAMGSPFGLTQTLTAGIVSAKGRAVGIIEGGYEDFIQTDAAINPGNSGGPLVNLKGEVVGINTAIFSRSGGFMGIGFAIPSNMARHVMEVILKEGRVVRGFIGVHIQPLTAGLARSFGYESTEGALVAQVLPGSPAAKGGLRRGDIILRVGELAVRDVTQLRNHIATLRPGSKVELGVFRDGRETHLSLVVGEQETEQPAEGGLESTDKLGLGLRALTPQLARQLGQEETLTGVMVTRVEPGSLADEAGLRVRDIIVEVQGEPVENPGNFRREIGKFDLKNQGVRLQIRRGQSESFVLLGPSS
jgi:serine protease Do